MHTASSTHKDVNEWRGQRAPVPRSLEKLVCCVLRSLAHSHHRLRSNLWMNSLWRGTAHSEACGRSGRENNSPMTVYFLYTRSHLDTGLIIFWTCFPTAVESRPTEVTLLVLCVAQFIRILYKFAFRYGCLQLPFPVLGLICYIIYDTLPTKFLKLYYSVMNECFKQD